MYLQNIVAVSDFCNTNKLLKSMANKLYIILYYKKTIFAKFSLHINIDVQKKIYFLRSFLKINIKQNFTKSLLSKTAKPKSINIKKI